MIVIDASAFVASIMHDEGNDKIGNVCELIISSTYVATVPTLFYYESAHVLLKSLRRKRIEKYEYEHHLKLLLAFPLIVDEETPVFEIALLAEKYDLSFYDAAYLELAIRQNSMLATLDIKLSQAAKTIGIKLVV